MVSMRENLLARAGHGTRLWATLLVFVLTLGATVALTGCEDRTAEESERDREKQHAAIAAEQLETQSESSDSDAEDSAESSDEEPSQSFDRADLFDGNYDVTVTHADGEEVSALFNFSSDEEDQQVLLTGAGSDSAPVYACDYEWGKVNMEVTYIQTLNCAPMISEDTPVGIDLRIEFAFLADLGQPTTMEGTAYMSNAEDEAAVAFYSGAKTE